VALVVFGKQQPLTPVELPGAVLQLLSKKPLLVELLLDPDGDRHTESREPSGGVGEVGLEQPLELE